MSQIKVVTELPVSTLDPCKRTAHGEHKTGGILRMGYHHGGPASKYSVSRVRSLHLLPLCLTLQVLPPPCVYTQN